MIQLTLHHRSAACRCLFAGLLLAAGADAASAQTGPCRVTPDGAPTAAWTYAGTLKSALETTSCHEIWIMEGVYTPISAAPGAVTDDDRSRSFTIRPGVAVYGGFAGNETMRLQRDPRAHPTILSGDIGGDDNNGGDGIDETWADIVGDNSYHVVVIDGTGATTVTADTRIDGVTITAGDAEDPAMHSAGGGLYCAGNGNGSECSPTLENVVFRGNRADNYGGAVYLTADHSGVSRPAISDATFAGNHATFGGALFNDGRSDGDASPSLRNVTLSGNKAVLIGGAIYNDGEAGASNPHLANVTISGNWAGTGGGIANKGTNGGASTAYVVNSILWDNHATSAGADLDNDGNATAVLFRSVISHGCPTGNTCNETSVDDPALGSLADNGGFAPTMMIGAGSAAIGLGAVAACPRFDERGAPRFHDSQCDAGAVELTASPVVTVSNGTDYVRYGQNVEYVVTLLNLTSAAYTSPFILSSSLPPQLDVAGVSWRCLDLASGCSPSGGVVFADTVPALAGWGRVRWAVDASVKANASEANPFTFEATAQTITPFSWSTSGADEDTLGLFRDGFD